MGYDTDLIFVKTIMPHSKAKPSDYRQVIAHIDMCVIACDNVGALIDLKRKESKARARPFRKELDRYRGLCQTHSDIDDKLWGVRRESEVVDMAEELAGYRKKMDEKHNLCRQLNKKLPCVFWGDGDDENFEDCYGDPLMDCSLEELEVAIALNREQDMKANENHYWGYDLALALIRAFKDSGDSDCFRVILWGH